jgi:hypothetical protein
VKHCKLIYFYIFSDTRLQNDKNNMHWVFSSANTTMSRKYSLVSPAIPEPADFIVN